MLLFELDELLRQCLPFTYDESDLRHGETELVVVDLVLGHVLVVGMQVEHI